MYGLQPNFYDVNFKNDFIFYEIKTIDNSIKLKNLLIVEDVLNNLPMSANLVTEEYSKSKVMSKSFFFNSEMPILKYPNTIKVNFKHRNVNVVKKRFLLNFFNNKSINKQLGILKILGNGYQNLASQPLYFYETNYKTWWGSKSKSSILSVSSKNLP